MKKYIAMLLATVLLCSSAGGAVFAVKSDAEALLLFADDFSALKDGSKPVCGNADAQWTQIVENAEKKLVVSGAEDEGNMALYIHGEEGGQNGSPRIAKRIDLRNYAKLMVEFRAKSGGAALNINFSGKGGVPDNKLFQVTDTDWKTYRIEIDLVKETADVYVNRKCVEEDKPFTLPDLATAEVRFVAAVQPDQGAYLDDVVISGVELGEDDIIAGPGAAYASDKPHEIKAPAGAEIVWQTDMENGITDQAMNCYLFDKASKYADIKAINGNKVLRFYGDDGISHGPSVWVYVLNVKTFTLEYSLMPGEWTNTVSLYADRATKVSFNISADRRNILKDKWNHVKIDVDLNALKASCYVNAQLVSSSDIKKITNLNTLQLRIQTNIKDSDMYFDNFMLYTMEDREYTSPLKGNQEIVWEYVKPEKPISADSYVKNLRAHPRLMVTDWAQVKKNIENSYEAQKWYASIKQRADAALLRGPVEYALKDTGNILDAGRELLNRCIALAFTYNITGDRRYLEKCYNDIIYSGTWPNWSGFVSSLPTTETVYGVACAYDWLYYDLTPEQRKNIIDVMKKQAMPDFIYNYEGIQTSTDYTVSPEGWMVSCNTNILGMAIAIADEEPEIAEYFIEQIPEICHIMPERFYPQGANASGLMYWSKVNEMLTIYADMLDNSFAPGYRLPSHWYISEAQGMSETCDQPIFFTGPTGRFEYGDCSSGFCTGATYYYAANRYDRPEYASYHNKMSRKLDDWMQSYFVYCPVFAIVHYDPTNTTANRNPFPLDKFYIAEDGFNGFAMRSSFESDNALFGAMQGGYADASHMYPTLGTYVIDYHHKRFVSQITGFSYAEAGAGSSVKQYYYKRAEGNNCLTMNPTAEKDQEPKGFAQTIASGASDTTAFGVMDMTSTNADYISAKRGMMLTDNRNRIIIQDEVVAKAPSDFYWFAHTSANVSLARDGKSALMELDGERMLVRIIEGPENAKLSIMGRDSLFDEVFTIKGHDDGIKLVIQAEDVQNFNLAVEYVGLEDGEGIPAPSVYVPMDKWSAEDTGKSATREAYDATVLKLDSPNAIANGEKTFVDTTNMSVVPFTQNGRTLVPVRFISESFGAQVGWDDATQAVSVTLDDKNISLVIGSNEMKMNGETVVLDVPAQTVEGRTLIPLRALAEALGKNVFWDDRGLIVISADPTPYSAEAMDKMVHEMNVRVQIDGKDMAWFELSRSAYTIAVLEGAPVPQISVSTIGDEIVSVTQANAVGEVATVQITANGVSKTYTFHMQKDGYKDMIGLKSLNRIQPTLHAEKLPDEITYIYVEDLVDSTNWATYPKRGIVDGVINEEIFNRWAMNGTGGWIQMDFGSVKNLHSMGFAGVYMTDRDYLFEVEVSADGENWTTVEAYGAKRNDDIMVILPMGDVQARYVRMNAKGTTKTGWNTWAEVRFYETEAQQNADKALWPYYFTEIISGKAGDSCLVAMHNYDDAGNIAELDASINIAFSVTDPSVASVGANGNVTLLKPGKTELVIRIDSYHVTRTIKVPIECK